MNSSLDIWGVESFLYAWIDASGIRENSQVEKKFDLGNRIKTIPFYILSQYLFNRNGHIVAFKPRLLAFILIPFYLISLPICSFLIPLLFFYLDKLDNKKDYTLGYACYCIKEGGNS